MPMRDWQTSSLSPAAAHVGTGAAIHWRMSPAGECTWLSPEWEVVTRQPADDGLGCAWSRWVHPDDQERVREAWAAAQAGGAFSVDLRIRSDGAAERWFRACAMPQPDRAAGWTGTAIDISDLVRALGSERATLHHRVRNTLAVIRSMARRTAETSETVDDYRSHFDGRLAAFSRTQGHIMRSGARGVDLEGLLADELLAHHVGGRVSYAGPEVRLSPRVADHLGLTLHELTANAVQYGALRPGDGRIAIEWRHRIEGDAALLEFVWTEEAPTGGIVAPQNYGFGLELLTSGLRYELDADVALDFRHHGLDCHITLPLAGEWRGDHTSAGIDPIERRA